MVEGLKKLYYMIKVGNISNREGYLEILGKIKSCRENNVLKKKLFKLDQKISEFKKNEIDFK